MWRASLFQFTPLREGRRAAPAPAYWSANFNSRPCVRGDVTAMAVQVVSSYFNSRPCVRGDRRGCARARQLTLISIHAPA